MGWLGTSLELTHQRFKKTSGDAAFSSYSLLSIYKQKAAVQLSPELVVKPPAKKLAVSLFQCKAVFLILCELKGKT